MSLKQHQIDGVKFLIDNENAIVGDQMGTGKTRLSLAFAKWAIYNNKADRALVLAPAALITNWCDEVQLYYGFQPAVYTGRKKNLTDNWVTLVSYEMLRYKKAGEFVHFQTLAAHFSGKRLILIADEGHTLKKDTNDVSICANQIPAKYRVLMTGTPVDNKPEDLYGVLKFADPRLDKDWFYQTFMLRELKEIPIGPWRTKKVWSIIGYKNQDLLAQYLGKRMIRRLKKECVDLPPKTVMHQPYDQTDSLYHQVVAQCDLDDSPMMTKVIRLMEAASGLNPDDPEKRDFRAGAKYAMLLQYLSGLVGSRVIVWFKFYHTLRHVLKLLEARGYDCYQWHGHNHSKREQELVGWGQSNGGIFLATLSAAGVGLNLVAGSTALYYETELSTGLVMQSEDRICRMGQTEPATIVYLYGRETVEEAVLRLVQKKRHMGEVLTDGFTDDDLATIYSYTLRLGY